MAPQKRSKKLSKKSNGINCISYVEPSPPVAVRVESEEEIIEAMKLTWARMKIVIEASCAVPLATLVKNRDIFAGRRVGVIITGGNVDLDRLPWIK